MANITIGQIIMEAQRMASRVKDLDTLGSALFVEAEDNNRHLESMRQFQDDVDSLNRITRDKSNAEMVNRINQQNPSIFEIRKENRELKACLEDHQRALELIMHKYREHTGSKVIDSKINFKEMYNEHLWKIIREQADKINEMAAVMQRAASLDDDDVYKEIQLLSNLKMENQTLRELLQISNQFDSNGRQILFNSHLLQDKAIQTENIDGLFEKESNSPALEVLSNTAPAPVVAMIAIDTTNHVNNSFDETANNNSTVQMINAATSPHTISQSVSPSNKEHNNNSPAGRVVLSATTTTTTDLPTELKLSTIDDAQKNAKDEQNSITMANGGVGEQMTALGVTAGVTSSSTVPAAPTSVPELKT